MTMLSQAKIFFFGAVLGAVLGATLLGAVAHLLLIGFALAGLGLAGYHGRRLVLRRARADKGLQA
jgi:hypothetical protein